MAAAAAAPSAAAREKTGKFQCQYHHPDLLDAGRSTLLSGSLISSRGWRTLATVGESS